MKEGKVEGIEEGEEEEGGRGGVMDCEEVPFPNKRERKKERGGGGREREEGGGKEGG